MIHALGYFIFVSLALAAGQGTETTQTADTAAAEPKEQDQAPDAVQGTGSFSTSTGELAYGLEVINSNLVTLSTQANDYAQVTDAQLDSAVQITAEATAILVNSQIIELQEQLEEVLQTEEELRLRMADSALLCGAAGDCGECAGLDGCVWCEAEQICVAGDRNGPLGGECSDFTYGECHGGCAEHAQCAACLADSRCGWCLNGGVCMEGSATDPGNCSASLWLFQSDQYGNTCPGAVGAASSYQEPATNPMVDNELSRLQRELRINIERESFLRTQLALVQGQLETVILQLNGADNTDIADLFLSNSLSGLGGVVDDTTEKNRKR